MKEFSTKLIVIVTTCLLLSSCGLKLPVPQFFGQKMESYSQERYHVALKYMEQSRFELASQQFAAAAESAESPELEELALEGYEKANKIIAGRR